MFCLAMTLPVAASASAPAKCFSGDFPSFLAAFGDQVAVQRAHTLVPLVSTRVEDAEPEPKQVVKKLAPEQIRFPVFALKAERARTPLTMTIKSVTATSASVQLEKPDTDYQLSYHFRKAPCWQLVRMENASL
jgi:hypothetical protein